MTRRGGRPWAEELLARLPASTAALNRDVLPAPRPGRAPAGRPARPRAKPGLPVPVPVPPGSLVLAIDGGYATCGWGLVERAARGAPRRLGHGAEREAPGGGDPLQRATAMARRVAALVVELAGGRPAVVLVEAWNPRMRDAGTQVEANLAGVGSGALAGWLALSLGGRAALGPGPAGVRAALGLRPSAPKAEVRDRVTLLLGLDAPPTPDHAADALALAVAAALRGVPAGPAG